ncbi:hypothetical protein [Ancylobacter terrae]|uniref:hypothetical protein n=1 Tax=Ancylobacter sp. sgz301288 TaxID=3342077 RepID=UPI0038590B4D
MTEFCETDHCQWLATSVRYFRAAQVLIDSPKFAKDLGLFLPTLQLTAHGLELLLKGNLIGTGMSTADVEKFRHDIGALWQQPDNAHLCDEVRGIAEEVRQAAEEAGRWDGGNICTTELLEEQVKNLASLHGSRTNYALRYPSRGLKGPSAPFLVETFDRTARLAVGNPTRFSTR